MRNDAVSIHLTAHRSGLVVLRVRFGADDAPDSRPTIETTAEPIPAEAPPTRPGLARAVRHLAVVPAARRSA